MIYLFFIIAVEFLAIVILLDQLEKSRILLRKVRRMIEAAEKRAMDDFAADLDETLKKITDDKN